MVSERPMVATSQTAFLAEDETLEPRGIRSSSDRRATFGYYALDPKLTPDGVLRYVSYLGEREDKPARECAGRLALNDEALSPRSL
jgi:hypothetical protein